MPITSAVDPSQRLIRFTVSGVIETSEILRAIDEVLPQIDETGGFDIISDHRALEQAATSDQIRALVEHLRIHGERLQGSRFAVIVGSEASYGMMRLLAVRAERLGIIVGVFWDEASALAVLRHR